ncbi:LysR family transcriptional regulator [Janibacter indicus]|uniref:LysR family transcriptional regulator n=1 Tax=Janibacter indicus TaxID=857417 RepID=UPI003D9A720E
MHTELLQTFVVVVRTGSMTAAALELGVVQSTVSGHLRSLERQFGVKLLDRHPHGVSPTEAGRRLAPIAQDLLDTQARMLSEVVSRDPHPSGRVGVAAPESLCAYRLAALIPALRSVAPDVSLRFSPATTGVALDAVRAGTVEIALVMEAELAATDVRVERLGGEDLACLAAPGMAAELGPSLSWQTLASHETVLLEDGCSYTDATAARLLAAGQSSARRTHFGSIEAAKHCAIAGLGWTVLPRVAAERELATGSLVELDAPLPPMPSIYVVTNPHRTPTAAMVTVLRDIRSVWR